MAFRALEAAENAVWAMESSALAKLLEVAAREHDVTPQALEAYQAKALANAEQARVRDGVAIISANGPLFKRANIMTALSGATSYDIMRKDLQAAVDGGKVKGAILNLDTPGGEASGVAELAAYVASLRGKFPVVAYVNGMAASAGYWLASAAQEIVVDSTAILGSIGVQMAMRTKEDPKGTTTHTFISSQSPLKNASPDTEVGAEHIQGVVNAMAQVFVETVAANRGVATETVLSDFGKGGILVGQDAVRAGLADRIGNFEDVLSDLSRGRRTSGKAKGATMSDDKTFSAADVSAAVATAVADAMAQANARNGAVTALISGFGLDNTVLAAALASGKSVAELAVEHSAAAVTGRTAAIDAARKEGEEAGKAAKSKAVVTSLKTDEEIAAEVAASGGTEPSGEAAAEAASVVDSILADAGLKKGK